MYCPNCGGPIKPKITFFGEDLPDEFMIVMDMLPDLRIDLLLVMGTALAVAPFNYCVNLVDCPKVLINLNNTAAQDFDFDN